MPREELDDIKKLRKDLEDQIARLQTGENFMSSMVQTLQAIASGKRPLQPRPPVKTEPYKETYPEVIFYPARIGEERDVIFGVNGTCLTVQRNKPVILPQSFLDSIDHCVDIYWVPDFDPRSGESRKLERRVPKFTYNKTGNVFTREEYERMLREGTKIQLKNVAEKERAQQQSD